MPSKIEKQRLHLEKLAANCRNLQQNSEPSGNVPPDNPASSLSPPLQPPHLPAFPRCSKEEILSEYMNFLRHLPPLIEKEKVKVIENVKSYLKIDPIVHEFHKLDFNNLLNIKEGSHILDNLSVEHGRSFKILCPPVQKCLLCGSDLTVTKKPTQVAVHGLTGPSLYSKYNYRCRGCPLTTDKDLKQTEARQDVYYHHDRVSIVCHFCSSFSICKQCLKLPGSAKPQLSYLYYHSSLRMPSIRPEIIKTALSSKCTLLPHKIKLSFLILYPVQAEFYLNCHESKYKYKCEAINKVVLSSTHLAG